MPPSVRSTTLLLALALPACHDAPQPIVLPPVPADVLSAAGATVLDGFTGEATVPPQVQVADADGKPVAGVRVDFRVVDGGGTLSETWAVTGANGRARTQRWILGASAGAQHAEARLGSQSVVFTANAAPRPPTPWQWRFLGAPGGVKNVESVVVDPNDPRTLYVPGTVTGVTVSHDGGATWTHALDGVVSPAAFALDPARPGRVFAGVGRELAVSADYGQSWTRGASLPGPIRSLHWSPRLHRLFAGTQQPAGAQDPPRIFASDDDGATVQGFAYGLPASTQVLPWTIGEDPASGALLVGMEIADHPQPYHPPLLRSTDGGRSWTDATGPIPWHVTHLEATPPGSAMYALTEGGGLFVSSDGGAQWLDMGRPVGGTLRVDAAHPRRVYGGEVDLGRWSGGVYAADDGGYNFAFAGLANRDVAGLDLNPQGTRLYAAVFGEGIYVADVPSTLR